MVGRRKKLEINRNGDRTEVYALITASPFRFEDQPLVLLVIENISEIAELQLMIPICSVCREVRDEKQSWLQVEAYFKEHWNVDFSHSLCPKCYEAEMKKLDND